MQALCGCDNPLNGGTTAAGTGLGLAIAKAIASGTGTTLDLLSPATGRKDGCEVWLKIGVWQLRCGLAR